MNERKKNGKIKIEGRKKTKEKRAVRDECERENLLKWKSWIRKGATRSVRGKSASAVDFRDTSTERLCRK